MRAYTYVAFSDAGKKSKGTLVAESEAQAAETLKAQGLFATEINLDTVARKNMFSRSTKVRLSDDMRAIFTRQMAVLLSAEIAVEAALETVRTSDTAAAIETVSATAKAALLDGQPLSVALEQSNAGFAPFYIAAVSAGEKSGDIAAVFIVYDGYCHTFTGSTPGCEAL